MSLTQTQLNDDILRIELLHGRLGDDLSKSMGYHSGNWWYIKHLTRKALLVGRYIEILYRYNADGSDTLENVLTDTEIEGIIDDSYRQLEQYNT